MMSTDKYSRLKYGLKGLGLFKKVDSEKNLNYDSNEGIYESIFYLSKEQVDQAKKIGSVAGFKDVVTNKLYWDFDSVDNVELAKKDAIELIGRLKENKFKENEIQAYFSGKKGVSVVIETNNEMTPEEVKSICVNNFGEGLTTLDTQIYDHARMFRVPMSKHQETKLRKIPLEHKQLNQMTVDQIKEIAGNDDLIETIEYSKHNDDVKKFIKNPEPKKNNDISNVLSFDFNSIDNTMKPKFLDLSRWYLQNGFFNEGERSHALICLASTYKNQGYHKDITYRMLKGVAEIQAKRTGMERFSDSDIYNNIVMQVYSNTWKGGQYTTKDPNSWLYQYCRKYNIKLTEDIDSKPQVVNELGEAFIKYAKSFFETRIYTGLADLDEKFPITAGSNIGIIGAASSGKTSLALNILEKANEQGCNSVFASLDMTKSRLYEKLLYKVTNGEKTRDDIFNDYLSGKGSKYDKLIKERYAKTFIFAKSAPDVEAMRNYILDVQDLTGEAVRLLMIDYFERISSSISDDTASSKKVAGEIQDLLSDFPDLTTITLVQPNKFSLSGGPDSPILSYTSIKGSSFLYQSFRQILSLWRPFFNPRDARNDKFMEMAILKNDLGELDLFEYSWRGKTGEINPLDDLQRAELELLKQERENQRAGNNNNNDSW